MLSYFRRQNGNAFFIILIAVVLFAALSYAITRSSRSGTDSVSAETNKLLLNQILSYVNAQRNAVTRMQLNGISKGIIADYLNVGVDLDCGNGYISWTDVASYIGGTPDQYMHHPDGGGVPFEHVPPKSINLSSPTVSGCYGNSINHIPGVGVALTTNGDYSLTTLGTTDSLCKLLNSRTPLGPTIPTVDGSAPTLSLPSGLYGAQEFCIHDLGNDSNQLWFVMIPDL